MDSPSGDHSRPTITHRNDTPWTHSSRRRAHSTLSGQFSVLRSAGSSAALVYLERFTSDRYLEKPSAMRPHRVTYDHFQDRALDPDSGRGFITDATKTYLDAVSCP
ncbi:Scr1 family TA system antitoxin-like transcriptional regulator [Streptomyces sp. NBC_00723]|uniref:Scr1 family TA system antitoxin-like transcriptional regulator n=1 Tax=Streptomyces sp. NBC_00723 TaxID=2903673 RepID=UPI003863BAB6